MSDPAEPPIEEPGLWARCVQFAGRIPREDRLVIGWVLALKVLLFILGVSVIHVFENKRLPSFYDWLLIWRRWDSLHILEVAKSGYGKAVSLIVYPLYPTLIRLVTLLTRDTFISALLISGVASIIAALLFRRLVTLDYPRLVARRAVWFFLIFPTAYFLHVAYSESLFLLLVFGCLYAARLEQWPSAGVLAGLAAMTRANGLALLPTLIVEAFLQWRTLRKWRWHWLWILAIPAGYCVYLFINHKAGGAAFAFLQTRRQIFRTAPAAPWFGIRELYRNLNRHPNQAEIVGAQELVFVTLGLVCAVISWIRLRASYATWITVTWLGAVGQTFVQSAPRYTLVMFPIFILFGRWTRNQFWNAVITIWSLLYFGYFAALFARGWWAF